MTNRTVEATLRLSSRLGNMAAFGKVSQQLAKVDAQAKRFNRSQMLVTKGLNAASAAAMRWLGPTVVAYGAQRSVRYFAEIERSMTRTALKIGASRAEQERLGHAVDRTAQKYALQRSEVRGLIDAYAETGAELTDINKDMDVLAKATQGLGADGRDVVNAWDAAKRSLRLTTKDAGTFFDLMAAGGAGGKFEGSDLARYLPSLAPVAAAQGFSGTEGAAQLIGLLETMRDYVGTSQEAATATADFLEKISSPDVEKRFGEAGVNLRKELKKARNEGENILDVMSKLIQKATKGDATRLSELFGERDSRRVARMLFQNLDALHGKVAAVKRESRGMIDNNVNRVLKDAQSGLDKFGNIMSKMGEQFGRSLNNTGVLDQLAKFVDWMEYNNAVNEGLEKQGVHGFAARTAWGIMHSDEEKLKVANSVGYFSPEQRKKMEVLGGIAPLPSSAGEGRQPLVPLSAIRAGLSGATPDAYARWRFGGDISGPHAPGYIPPKPMQGPPMRPWEGPGLRPQFGSVSPRQAEAGSMAALNRDRGAVEFDIERALMQLEEGGRKAGDKMGSSAIDAIGSRAAAIGRTIGEAAARAFGGAGRIRADTGRDAFNVKTL